jgi:hypothetical protein
MGFALSTNGLLVDDWSPTEPTLIEQQESTNAYDLLELTKAVLSLPPRYYTEYDPWLRVGMALQGTDPGLLYLWERFSQQSLTNYRPGVCEQKWATFRGIDCRVDLPLGAGVRPD